MTFMNQNYFVGVKSINKKGKIGIFYGLLG